MREKYTDEVRNLATPGSSQAELGPLLTCQTTDGWWDLLESLDVSLAVSREYEHFVVLLGSTAGQPSQSALSLPHPSGLYHDPASGQLIVSSTRTPNQILWFRPLSPADYAGDLLPSTFQAPEGTMYLPFRSVFLPGTLYIHDLALVAGELVVTATGHNFVARVRPSGGWERAWWPRSLEPLGRSAFDQNYLQLNSIAVGDSLQTSFYTAFSDDTFGPKPWKAGYGPRGRGVLFSGATREVVLRGLTCPHSARWEGETLWLCNSGYGEVGYLDAQTFHPVVKLPGFTRGLAFHKGYAFVGLSKVIDFYEPYAPGLEPKESRCGIVALDLAKGVPVASLTWDQGYQIYDVQVMPGVRRPLLPSVPDAQGVNTHLRYLG